MAKRDKTRVKKYPRAIDIEVKKPITVIERNGLYVKCNQAGIFLCDKFGHRYSEADIVATTTYQGENKHRIINKVTGLPEGTRDVTDILKTLDVVYACDTNTRSFNEADSFKCSVGVVYKAVNEMVDKNGGTLQCMPYKVIRWRWNAAIEIENYSWIEAIKEIQKEDEGKRIGLVIDSNLGHIDEYNSRILALADKFFLPENFTLIYASADRSDGWMNKLIKQCDKMASEQLKKYIKELQEEGIKEVPFNAALCEIIPVVVQFSED